MNLYIMVSFLHNDFINKINTVFVAPFLYMNGENYFLFINNKTLQPNFKTNPYNEIDEKYLTEYHINYNKRQKDSFDYLSTKIPSLKTITFILPEHEDYELQKQLFLKYFNINKYFERRLNNLVLKQEYFSSYFIEEKELNFDENLIKKYMIKKHVSDKIFAFFNGNTTLYERVDLLYLCIDYILKHNKKSKYVINVTDGSNSQIFNAFKNVTNEVLLNFQNIYMYIDFESSVFNINKTNKYRDFSNGIQVEYNNEKYMCEHNIQFIANIEETKIHLIEIINYLSKYFSVEDIYYKLLDFYEKVNIGFNNEVISYEHLNLNLNILKYLDDLYEQIDNNNFLIDQINNLTEELKERFHENSQHIQKCPYCIDGYIYKTKDKFFCYECNFFLHLPTIQKKYNINLTTRRLKMLLKDRYISLDYNGELRTFFILDLPDAFYLKLLRKK